MLKYIIKRILLSICILIGVVLLVFIILHVLPGNPIITRMKNHVNLDVATTISERLGITKPIHEQFFDYITNILSGDFGRSIKYNKNVLDIIKETFPNTLILSVSSIIFALFFGFLLATIAAIKKNNIFGCIFQGVSILGISIPAFVISITLQYIFSFKFHFFSITSTDLNFFNLILPTITLGWSNASNVYMLAYSLFNEHKNKNYAIFAKSKGESNLYIIFHHIIKNTYLPLLSQLSMQFSALLSGAIITETIFAINGIGRLSVDAIISRDIPLIQGTTILSAIIIISLNLLVDCICKLSNIHKYNNEKNI